MKAYSGWEKYSGTRDGMRYSSATQINLSNVSRLKEVWRYSSKDRDPENLGRKIKIIL
ncbi:hypothetical protein LZ575_02395 [Antarcticibacterium sp. 1MA-6-2]|uniref:hypothetical protein n=1 Tax=Antarcticibacterium sp. 1MA-6-2 TaxID=2908210 RepID=UPI001F2ED31C|nr:hypothetical protein [Antarcticibacterium sp. 1MA-6-2]UJH91585.1 hypothetical protein LZ575_02395 [Antarcticibacterium sp. 1MA-6-2]